MSEALQKILVVAGPTASGKSDFAVELALKENGEIISVDSRQVYKGLDIGTGKITKEEMRGIPHHMLDVYDVKDTMVTVARFRDDALPLISDIYSRGKTPILCGGSGQYLHALLTKQEFPSVPFDAKFRASLEAKSVFELASLLKEKDAHRYATIDTKNKVRLIRALEILTAEKEVKHNDDSEKEHRFDATMYLMCAEKEVLRKRIRERLEKRLKNGMIEEVERLLASGVPKERLLFLGLEYKYITLYLTGELQKEEMHERLIITTWQYAKRQMTWNKKYIKNSINIEVK